ncbi:hypothetical protein Pan14r_02400 [Crateriforma conspicua]|uniref:PDZ domain-containing protein n=1 Tax=Crateriforma conspicua TaxID=2527996 RepID=A0A5C5Y3D1_9PLAN|nr:hypothetical protein Pan14r_02400 [Crateriforma conspicua]
MDNKTTSLPVRTFRFGSRGRYGAAFCGILMFAASACAKTGESDSPNRDPMASIAATATEVVAGQPMGFGKIVLTFVDGEGPVIYPDQTIRVVDAEQRVFYPVVTYQYDKDEGAYQASSIEANFALKGDGPLSIQLVHDQDVLFEESLSSVKVSAQRVQKLRDQWWRALQDDVARFGQVGRAELQAILDTMAFRFGIPEHRRIEVQAKTMDSKSLEDQFERAVKMLLGFESVQLAIHKSTETGGTASNLRRDDASNADMPLPKRRTVRSLRIPDFPATAVEAISHRTPAECFYVRTGSVNNYRHLRRLLVGWGGSLDDVVATSVIEQSTRQKIERQLGLPGDPDELTPIEPHLSDLALIGSDPFFDDGAAVGLLMQAKSTGPLKAILQQWRDHAESQTAGCNRQQVNIAGHAVDFLGTSDHLVRSFLAEDDGFLLITNSKTLVQRFFETGRGIDALGKRKEFQYAKWKTRGSGQGYAFLYLGDPFFQNLISPHYRIEMLRRERALNEIRQLKIAHLMAAGEGNSDLDDLGLIRERYLPETFGQRPDDARAFQLEEVYQDSLRGVPGTFLPIPDVPLDRATRMEVATYQRFASEYLRLWRRADPVAVVFRDEGIDPGSQHLRTSLQIVITPYAEDRYRLLRKHLGPATSRALITSDPPLLYGQATVRMSERTNTSHHILFGIRDDRLDFQIDRGKVRLDDAGTSGLYASSRGFLAMRPGRLEVLKMLASVLLKGEEYVASKPASAPKKSGMMPPPNLLPGGNPSGASAIIYLGWALSKMRPSDPGMMKYASMVDLTNENCIVGESADTRQWTRKQLVETSNHETHQAFLTMNPLHGSKVEPYIQAYTFMQARHHSSQGAIWLDRMGSWFRVPEESAKQRVQTLLGGDLVCPLGGEYIHQTRDGDSAWTSTRWETDSAFDVTAADPQWRFPFLDWLQALRVEFDMSNNTLYATVHLEVADGDRDSAGIPRGVITTTDLPSSTSPNHGLVSKNLTTPLEQVATDWVLGVRAAEFDRGVVITHVYPNSPAQRAGLRNEDIVLGVDGNDITTSDQLREFIRQLPDRSWCLVRIQRGSAVHRYRVHLPKD